MPTVTMGHVDRETQSSLSRDDIRSTQDPFANVNSARFSEEGNFSTVSCGIHFEGLSKTERKEPASYQILVSDIDTRLERWLTTRPDICAIRNGKPISVSLAFVLSLPLSIDQPVGLALRSAEEDGRLEVALSLIAGTARGRLSEQHLYYCHLLRWSNHPSVDHRFRSPPVGLLPVGHDPSISEPPAQLSIWRVLFKRCPYQNSIDRSQQTQSRRLTIASTTA